MQPLEYIADVKFSMAYFLPEITLFLLFVSLVLFGIVFRKQAHFIVPLVFLIGMGFTTYYLWIQYRLGIEINLFSGALLFCKRSIYLKVLFTVCGIFTLIFRQLSNYKEKPTEFYGLVTAIIFGSGLMVMASNFLVAFLALEIISLSSYILVALPNHKRNAEASLKYLLYGMFSSAIMLYGVSLLFGFTGTTNFMSVDFYNKLANIDPLPVTIALIMVMTGILFKITAFPFHFWAADVYESTPISTLVFFTTCSKIAGFGFLLNFMPVIWQFNFKSYVEWFNPECLIGFCAAATIGVGNLMAISQKNVKRMLAYSAIAHTGFILLPLTSFEKQTDESVLYYLAVYLFISFASFFIVEKAVKLTEDEQFESFKGLGFSHPLVGILVIISMVGLAGLPPTTGFFAKFYIFSSVWDSYTLEQEQLFLYLFLFGLINTVIGLFYYLKLPYFMFLKQNDVVNTKRLSFLEYLFAIALSLSLLLLFAKPEWLKF
ncbi:MAG: NADH-quinone oxidoreductase subunit N [Cytophagales bacterium]